MASRLNDAQRARLARAGSGMLEPTEALDAFGRALATDAAYSAIINLEPSRMAAQAAAGARALLGLQAAAANPASETAHDVLAGLDVARTASMSERISLLRAYVRREAARVLGFNPSALDADTPLSALGFDSLMSIQFRNRVATDLSLEVPLAQLLAGPTVEQLTEELATRLGPVPTTAATLPDVAWEEGTL